MNDDVVAQHPLPIDPTWFSEVPAGQHYTLGRMAEVLRESGCIVSAKAADTMDARVGLLDRLEELACHLETPGGAHGPRYAEFVRDAANLLRTASDTVAQAPHPQFFAVDYTGCIHSFGSEDDAIKAAQQFAETANGGTPTLTRSALLAAQAPQQPVAWRMRERGTNKPWMVYPLDPGADEQFEVEPLYASPPREEDEGARIIERPPMSCLIGVPASVLEHLKFVGFLQDDPVGEADVELRAAAPLVHPFVGDIHTDDLERLSDPAAILRVIGQRLERGAFPLVMHFPGVEGFAPTSGNIIITHRVAPSIELGTIQAAIVKHTGIHLANISFISDEIFSPEPHPREEDVQRLVGETKVEVLAALDEAVATAKREALEEAKKIAAEYGDWAEPMADKSQFAAALFAASEIASTIDALIQSQPLQEER